MSEPEPIYEWMSPQEKRARALRNNGPVPKRVRPCDLPQVKPTADEQAVLDALKPEPRLTRWREMIESCDNTP